MLPSNGTDWILLILGVLAGFYIVKHLGSGGSVV